MTRVGRKAFLLKFYNMSKCPDCGHKFETRVETENVRCKRTPDCTHRSQLRGSALVWEPDA